MVTVKVLKRKDASSVAVAVVLGLIVAQAVEAWAARPVQWLTGVNSGAGGWRVAFWEPLLLLVIEAIILEVGLVLYTTLVGGRVKK